MASTLLKPGRRQQKSSKVIIGLWLLATLLAGAGVLILWTLSAAPVMERGVADRSPEVATEQNLNSVTQIAELNELSGQVQPVTFDALLRDLRDYPPEFKDKRYLQANKGKWTVQVMDVSKNDIITDYLQGRDDRQKFAYFRYRDENNQSRYVLTYDVMASSQMATGMAKMTDFDLPANVRVLPEKIERYLDIIENYEISEPIQDLSTGRVRNVKLQSTKRELAVRVPKPAPVQTSRTQTNDASNTASPSSAALEEPADTNRQASGRSDDQSQSIRRSSDSSQVLTVDENRSMTEDKPATSPNDQGRPAASQAEQTNTQSAADTNQAATGNVNNQADNKKPSSQQPNTSNDASDEAPSASDDPIGQLIKDNS